MVWIVSNYARDLLCLNSCFPSMLTAPKIHEYVYASLSLVILVFYFHQSKPALQKRIIEEKNDSSKDTIVNLSFSLHLVVVVVGCTYPQVSGQPFFESIFLFFRCSINMYLSWYILSESPFTKDTEGICGYDVISCSTFLYMINSSVCFVVHP